MLVSLFYCLYGNRTLLNATVRWTVARRRPADGGSILIIDSRTGHHDAQIRTLHIVRNVFAFTERIPPE